MLFPAGLLNCVDGFIIEAQPLMVSWHSAAPSAGGSNEITTGGAARLPVGTLRTSSDSTAAEAANSAAITSAAATAAWPTVTHLALVDAASGGVFQGSAVDLALGEKIRIPAGDLTLTIPAS